MNRILTRLEFWFGEWHCRKAQRDHHSGFVFWRQRYSVGLNSDWKFCYEPIEDEL